MKVISLVRWMVGISLVSVWVGCSAYRIVRRTPSGGELALLGERDGALEKASDFMAAQCPKGFDVLEEYEVVVGYETTNQTTSERKGSEATDSRVNASSAQGRTGGIKHQESETDAHGLRRTSESEKVNTTSSTSEKRETRIKYQCKGQVSQVRSLVVTSF